MKQFLPDKKQQAVIDFNDGYALVLAAPGCGKTEILSHRIKKAHYDYGIPYEDMLCVTFTNRASREMKERVKGVVGDVMDELFVGNLHRFCINFLYDNELIPIDTGIIDDTDQAEIVSEILNNPYPYASERNGVLNYACLLKEQEYHFPYELVLHQGAGNYYKNQAVEYNNYKEENKLIDFDDILFLTYKALMEPDYRQKYKRASFRWIQVDEVQDLNPLQLAIISKLTSEDPDAVVYLGDERQAIYSFLGTRHDSITSISHKCGNNVFYLSNNYRAPRYLLDMLNDYAVEELGVEQKLLPQTYDNTEIDDALTTVKCNGDEQYNVIATLTREIYLEAEKESVGILVRTNKDADAISEKLDEHNIRHIKITNKDMFKAIPFKTLYSHFSVVAMDTRFSEWTRLLYQVKAIDKIRDSQRVVREMRKIGLTPVDLLTYEHSSYFMQFCGSFARKEIVIFDTETTGLDIFNDDIIQIAAMKVRNGHLVYKSELDIIIRTDKEIPKTLKNGLNNPMIEEYRRRSAGQKDNPWEMFMEPEEAFEYFLNYVGDDEVLGHNINYDIHILENNIKRRTNINIRKKPVYWDTLKMSRMLDPNLRKHNLESLIEIYDLDGKNSHNAMDDIKATRSLMNYCHSKMLPLMRAQLSFLGKEETKKMRTRLMQNYYPLYKHTLDKLYSDEVSEENTFDSEFQFAYHYLTEHKYIKPIERFDYMRALFNKVVIDHKKDVYFYQQLVNHIYEFRTFNEADLYQNGIINERIHIMTIHKAKGLEFDNVIVYNVSFGVFPNRRFRNNNPEEDARVLYVAMSRARKRLFLTYNYNISEFISGNEHIQEHFYDMPQGQKARLLKMEEKFVKFSKDELK